LASPATGARPPAAAGDSEFAQLVDTLVDEYVAFHPGEATSLGLHSHDSELEDLSPAGVARELAWAERWSPRLAGVVAERLSAASRFDLGLVRHAVAERRFALSELRDSERRPGIYLRLAADGVNQLIKRDFAPAAARLRSVLARQAKIPALLEGAEQSLTKMAPVSIDITLSDLEATIQFFLRDVPLAFPAATERSLQPELKQSCERVATALRRFGDFLRRERRGPRSRADFALGPELLRRRLWAEEMIDEPLESLQKRSEVELARLRSEFVATARQIDAGQPTAKVQLEMQKDHPKPAEILAEIRARLHNQQQFLVDKGLVTLPGLVLPEVKESPAFMRATTLASMDAAGPFEASTTAYYYATLPEPGWRPEQTEDFLRGAYNRPLIDVVNIHEAFPGHYVQGLWLAQLSKARKVFSCNSNVEGWAHYSEQMMLDEHYGSGDPRLRLAQLQDALLRSARFVVALRMHGQPPGQGMSVAQATEFFVQQGMQTQKVAEMEALRGTQDPMYLVYTYGKLELLRLRDELKARRGPSFSLRAFHNELLGYGQGPLRPIREAMLATASGQ
jgi:uncharacterized protein (DUF885 family)